LAFAPVLDKPADTVTAFALATSAFPAQDGQLALDVRENEIRCGPLSLLG
jgi:hypothetical protein